MNFGKTVSTDEEEVTYLLMFAMSPKTTEPLEEEALWTKDFQKRLAEFTAKHPDFPSFKSFKIPDDVPEEDRGFWIASEIAAGMLPHEMATAKLWQSAREKQWPLVSGQVTVQVNQSLITGADALRQTHSPIRFTSLDQGTILNWRLRPPTTATAFVLMLQPLLL